MIKRRVFRAQFIKGKEESGIKKILDRMNECNKLVEDKSIMTLSLYRWEQNIFLYYEDMDNEIRPGDIFPELMDCIVEWPGEEENRKWLPMVDVFHFNQPESVQHWKRKVPPEKRLGKVAHLKPEMISSYIYYHFQLQEERAFLGDKYEYITLHENLLFMYAERPKVIEEPLQNKKLNTHGTPENWEESRMDLHFIPWGDGTVFFKEIEQVISI